jgi:threonine dehydratase
MDAQDILRAALNARVSDALPDPTPLERAPLLSARLGRDVFLKREDLTPIFSFKLRGAYNRIALLSQQEKDRGVITASAGNHAQGVAFAAAKLGLRARVVMPRTTPAIKVSAVRRFGAVVDLVGDDYSEAAQRCLEIAAETGMTVVPPFDDPDVIAGQATVGLEILRQATSDLGTIFVPVGGGGLAGGIAAVVKAVRPEIRVIGVEDDESDAMVRALREGKPVALEHVGIFADGAAVRQVGVHTFDLCRRYLDDCVTVSVDEICAAIKDVYEDTRSILEPAGALAVAGMKRVADEGKLAPGPVVAVASGANVNFDRLAFVAERAAVGEHREAILAVTIPERPGSFLEFARVIGERAVTEFNYRLSSRDAAHVFAGLAISGRGEVEALQDDFRAKGFECRDLTSDELAKRHVRHLVGGASGEAHDEVLYSFEFPERPGALLRFLAALGNRWNISLFHYRSDGSTDGNVLCGFEVPPDERGELESRLRTLGYAYRQETNSVAARLFLR